MLALKSVVPAQSMLGQAHTHIHFRLCDNEFTATLFGKGDSRQDDWSTTLLQHPTRGPEYRRRLGAALRSLQAGNSYAVNTMSFNAHLVGRDRLTTQLPLGEHVLRCNPREPAEGTDLAVGDAAVHSPADCAIVIAARNGYNPIHAHAGKRSLADHHAYQHNVREPGRAFASICTSMLDKLGAHSLMSAREVEVKVLWAIPGPLYPNPLDDPRHGYLNRKFYEDIGLHYGRGCVPKRDNITYPDLPRIIRAQFKARGVSDEKIDLTQGYLPQNNTWSNARGEKGRNGVIIVRKS